MDCDARLLDYAQDTQGYDVVDDTLKTLIKISDTASIWPSEDVERLARVLFGKLES